MTDSPYRILSGNLSEIQQAALFQTLDGIAEEAAAIRNAAPDTRGHYGAGRRTVLHANPAAFRNARLPRA